MIRFEIEADNYWKRVIFRKFRPVWDWERSLKFSASETGNEHQMAVWTQSTIGL